LRREPALWSLPPGALVLASASPRRRRLLSEQGLRFAVVESGVDESGAGGSPAGVARRLALAKARAVARRRPRAWCLGADTVVAVGSRLLGKPRDAAEAAAMLGALSGRKHVVHTGVALVGPGLSATRVVATAVRFRRLAAAEIAAYIATGEPFDKAGAYAAQGRGALLLAGIEGDWSNVVGLPLGAVRDLLAEAADRAARPRRGRGPRAAARGRAGGPARQ